MSSEQVPAISTQIFNVISLTMPGAPIKDDIFEIIKNLYIFAVEKILTSEAKRFKISSTRHDILQRYKFDIKDEVEAMNVNTFIKKLATCISTETFRLQSLYCVIKEIEKVNQAFINIYNIEDLYKFYFTKGQKYSKDVKKVPIHLIHELTNYQKLSSLTKFAILVFGEYLIAEIFDVSNNLFLSNNSNTMFDLNAKYIENGIKKDEELSAFFEEYKF